MKNNTIAYISHVPWDDIKQRPQFLALQMSRDFRVFYMQNIGLSRIFTGQKNVRCKQSVINEFLTVKGIWWINQYKIQNRIIKWFAGAFNSIFIKKYRLLLNNTTYIWFTHPSKYDQFKNIIPHHARVVYDCMDDALEFENYYISRKRLFEIEAELIKRASFVVCSSLYLQKKLVNRYKMIGNSIVVNNAIELPSIKDNVSTPLEISQMINDISHLSYPLIYIGAISAWFDFDLILNLLGSINDVNLVLVGPKSVAIPDHDRIKWYAPIERKYIFNIMPLAFALVMPFKINELIRSVNPVKLYEYIYSGKPSIAPRYSESEKFEGYTLLYDSPQNFIGIVNGLISKTINIPDYDKSVLFAKSNTWSERYKMIKELLASKHEM